MAWIKSIFNARLSYCLNTRAKISRTLQYSTNQLKNDDEGPIRYTKSNANLWTARASRIGIVNERLWYEPYVILASLSVFLLYFCVMREENDVDQELNKSLYSRISGLEEHQLKISLEYNKQHGMETKAIVERLNEIESEKDN